MKVSIEKNGTLVFAVLEGAFDHPDAQLLADELQPLVAETGARLANNWASG